MNDVNELYDSIVLANEADIANTATPEEKQLLAAHTDIHIEVLKTKKREVEYQFSSNKVIMQEYVNNYEKGILSKSDYLDAMLKQHTWKASAVSYLTRIDNKLIEVKCKQKIWNKAKETGS